MFGFYIESSQERALRGKWFVSASLVAQEGTADVTKTESRRFRQSPLAKAIDAPRSEHVASSKELLVGLVARDLLLTEISKHHFAIVQAGPAQESQSAPSQCEPPCDQHCQNRSVWPARSINALEHAYCSEVWRRNRSKQHLQRLSETHVDSE